MLVSSLMVEDGEALCAVILLAASIMSPMSVKGLCLSGTYVPLTGRRMNDTSDLFSTTCHSVLKRNIHFYVNHCGFHTSIQAVNPEYFSNSEIESSIALLLLPQAGKTEENVFSLFYPNHLHPIFLIRTPPTRWQSNKV